MDSCFAQTPMTAAEKRCARSATTASNSVLERSVDMQAMMVEMAANRFLRERVMRGGPPPRSDRVKLRVDRRAAQSARNIVINSRIPKFSAAGPLRMGPGPEPKRPHIRENFAERPFFGQRLSSFLHCGALKHLPLFAI